MSMLRYGQYEIELALTERGTFLTKPQLMRL